MRIVFMGTPEFAATILEELSFRHDVVCVYTRPDAVRGRGNKAVASPVKAMAESLEIPVRTPVSLRDPEEQAALAALAPDAICVAAYGMLLPKEVLDLPPYGCLNAHASLLPRWRGAAPVERAILAGDEETGVCIMRMEEGLDTGDYCIWRSAFIANKTADALTDELANLGAHALLTALAHIEQGAIRWISQGEEGMTYAAKIGRTELYPSPADSAVMVARKVQAASEAHPARCIIGGRGVSVEAAALPDFDDSVAASCADTPAGAVRFVAKRLFLGCTDGVVEVLRVKPDGKQAMEAKAFAAGIQGIKSQKVEWSALDAG